MRPSFDLKQLDATSPPLCLLATRPAQAATLKNLANAAYELDAFKPNLTRAEAEKRIITLTAKLKLLDEPPHTL